MSTETTSSTGEVHPVSEAGFGAGKSENYDKARPSYPPESLSHLRKSVSRQDRLRVVELGSGTGIFTRALLAHPEWASSIAEMRCIDPNASMRDVFAQMTDDARVSQTDGTFDKTGVPDGWADVVVAASAFHWCTDLPSALSELIRITTPSSTFAVILIIPDRTVPWVSQLAALVQSSFTDPTTTGASRFFAWRTMFSLPAYDTHFAPPSDDDFRSAKSVTKAQVVAYMSSVSGVAALPEEEKAKLVTRMEAVLERGEGMVWVDREAGVFEQPFVTNMVVMRRRV